MAVVNLIHRSTGISTNIIARHLHTSIVHFKDSSKKPSSGGDKKNQNNDENKRNDNDNNGKKGDENGEKMMSIVTKAILWIATIYILTTMFTMAIPQKNRPETSTRYVSWHEFVHHMLAVGEVRELIIRPDMEMVTIILFDGAIIKGRQYSANIFHMAVADTARFEQKLREVETKLGIREGVTVSYDRHSDLPSKILITLLIAAVIFSLLSRMKGMKSPISMDSFVSKIKLKLS